MANSDKNIVITPNRGQSAQPKITFTGQENTPITLSVLDNNTISFDGYQGQLFAISHNLSSGTIFSVNDISGIPSIRVNADGTVALAEFSGNVGIGMTNPAQILELTRNQNANTAIGVYNNNTGAASQTGLFLIQNAAGNQYASFEYLGSGFPTSGLQTASQGKFVTSSSATGGLFFSTLGASAPIIFGQGGIASTNERLRIGSTEIVFNDAAQNIDLRIEGQTQSNLFFVDASTDRIGISTSTPATTVQVAKSQTTPVQLDVTNTNGGANALATVSVGDGTDGFGFVVYPAAANFGSLGASKAIDLYSTSGIANMVFHMDNASGNIRFHTGGVPSASNEKFKLTSTEAIFNDPGNNYDFRVEGDTNVNLLFVDASTDRIGIGTNTPNTILDVSTGQLSIPAGSAATPGLAIRTDLDTGIFGPTANEFGIALGGTEVSRLYTYSSLVRVLRVGSEANPGALHLGRNNQSLDYGIELHVNDSLGAGGAGAGGFTYGSTASAGSAYFGIRARGSQTTPTATGSGDILVIFAGKGHTGSAFGTSQTGIYIHATQAYSPTQQPGMMSFRTTPNSSTTQAERFRISENGNVGVGDFGAVTVNPSALFTVGSSNLFTVTSTGAVTAQNSSNSTTAFRVVHSTGTPTVFNVDTSNQRVGVNTAAPATELELRNSGGTAGIGFNATTQSMGGLFGSGGNFTWFAETPGSASGPNLMLGGSTRGDAMKNAMALNNGVTEYFRIDGDAAGGHVLGRVGINVAIPGARLDIDNKTVAESILIARDNGTPVFTIADGGTTTLAGDFLPGSDDTYSLGSPSLRWKDGYFGAQSIHIGTSVSDEGRLSYDTSSNIFSIDSDGYVEIGTGTATRVNIGTPSTITNIKGDLIVDGYTISINSSVVDIVDRVIHVNSDDGYNTPLPTQIAGISVHRGDVFGAMRDHAGMFWVESNNRFEFAYNINGGDDLTLGSSISVKAADILAAGSVGIGTDTPTSKLEISGSLATSITTKTSDYSLTVNDSKVLVDASGGIVTITLPAASSCSGREYHIKKIDSSTNNMVINTIGGNTIDGASAVVTNVQYKAYSITSNGTNWFII